MGAVAVAELLVMVTLPVTLPPEVGAKRMVPAKLAPALMVSGRVKPEIEKPVPETVMAETVRVAAPVLRNMSAWLEVAPVLTLPNAILVCDKVRSAWGVVVEAVVAPPNPQPARATVRTKTTNNCANTGEDSLVLPVATLSSNLA